ncbi:hypothetical protein ATI61_10424 [Archangium gephyra]|uniref:Uncharacterized protein n=1 Tax=Archangium gephyra TaxID=48 RepID=A0AAC8Q3Y6_9BACT|nr:hypothetical protein [Archangium gephyra]AKJ00566.1 Hypothetical protein AA314_02192 [Archangium gephyra]REG32737.1 hypothetical protein ATI61_10424 [Archangium gephyra]
MTFPRLQLPKPGKRTLKLNAPRSVFPERMSHVYEVHTYSKDAAAFQRGGGVKAIRFMAGKLYVDDLPVLAPHFGKDGVTWSQRTRDHFTSGHLHYMSGGTELHGVIYRGRTPQDATEHHVLATTLQPVNYTTQITTRRYPAGTDPSTLGEDGWATGLVLQIGYTQGQGDTVPTPKVLLDEQDITSGISWSIDAKTQRTVLVLALDGSVVCDFDNSLYLTGSVEFDIDQVLPTFSGTITATCTDNSTGTGVYLWKGTAQAARADGRARLAPHEFTPLNLTAGDVLAADDSGLSIAELMSIIPDSYVSEMANTLLNENMKWAMGQSGDETKWLSMVFGENPPVIPPSQQDLINKSLSWYQGDFAKSYLGWAVSNYDGAGAPSAKLTDDQKLKLKYFLQTGLAKDKDFNTQQNGIYLQAFIQAKPRLQAYLKDTQGNWAQQLFDVVTSAPQMTLMINRVYGATGLNGAMAPANNFSTLLSALDPSGTLARQYYQAVLTGTVSNSVHQSTGGGDSELMEWLPDFLQQFLDTVAHAGTIPDEAKLAAQQIQQMMQEQGMTITQVAQEMSDAIVNANGANLLQKTQNAETAFVQKFPKFEKVGQMMFFAGWCVGVVMVVKAFQDWKNLSPEDKAKAVLSAVTLGVEALDIVPKFIQGIKSMGMDGWNKFTAWRNSRNGQDGVEDIESNLDEDWVRVGADETSPLFDATTGVVKTEGTLWETLFAGAAKVVAVIGVAVSAAFAVLSTIDFINDLRSGQPVTKDVFDGIMMATNILMTVCLVVDLFVATTVFAMAAAVLAIVGVIVAIIAMFVVKPKNPLDDFMNNVVIPFVEGLGPQTPPPDPGASSSSSSSSSAVARPALVAV